MQNAIRLHSTRCPKCAEKGKDRAGNNLAIYSDGHVWCFSCGYYQPGNELQKLKKTKKPTISISLPEDITKTIPEKPLQWLQQYLDYIPDRTYWSEKKQYLIFTIYDNEHMLLAYIGRYFGTNPNHPKWITFGINSSIIKLIKPAKNIQQSTCVLVEDIISAYKVGHIQDALPLFSAHINTQQMLRLQLLGYKKLIFWLDADKYKEKIKFAQQAQALGFETQVIQTNLDPKEYSYEEIEHELLTTN